MTPQFYGIHHFSVPKWRVFFLNVKLRQNYWDSHQGTYTPRTISSDIFKMCPTTKIHRVSLKTVSDPQWLACSREGPPRLETNISWSRREAGARTESDTQSECHTDMCVSYPRFLPRRRGRCSRVPWMGTSTADFIKPTRANCNVSRVGQFLKPIRPAWCCILSSADHWGEHARPCPQSCVKWSDEYFIDEKKTSLGAYTPRIRYV